MISPLAYVDPEAKLGKNVTVLPFAYIEKNVEIGDDCVIMSYASILQGTKMGKGNKIHQVPFGESRDRWCMVVVSSCREMLG